MKRLLSLVLACVMLLSGCGKQTAPPAISEPVPTNTSEQTSKVSEEIPELETVEVENPGSDVLPEFSGLDSPELLQFVEDSVYSYLESRTDTEAYSYILNNVTAIYVSNEYLEESEYNSQENIYFGYKLSELDAQYSGTRYVFTLGDDGKTIVQPFESYDDTYNQVIKNVATGTGVILICVTVSVISGGVGAPAAVSTIFAASAKTAASFALSSGAIGGAIAGIIQGYQTNDFDEAVKAAALGASEGFKWGAISGAIKGGIQSALTIYEAESAVRTWQESENVAQKLYGGNTQVTYQNGVKVAYGTRGASRPDIVREVDGVLEAIEVKNYDLSGASNLSELRNVLIKEVSQRVTDMPAGTLQKVCLDVHGRGYSEEYVAKVIAYLVDKLNPYYPNLPFDVIW